MSKPLRAGLIGAGAFGQWHASKYAKLQGVELAGIFDIDTSSAAAISARLGCRAFSSMEALVAAVDIVSVATPASSHVEVASQALRAGCHVMVEKPLAQSVDAADTLIALAQRNGRHIGLGHQESLVLEAFGCLDIPEKPYLVEAVRDCPASERGRDVPVAIDLMVHDAHLALATLGEASPIAVSAHGIRGTDSRDAIAAELAFANQVRVRLSSSRIAETPRRVLKLYYESGIIEIDLITRTCTNSTKYPLVQTQDASEVLADPLGANISHFVAAVQAPERRSASTLRAGRQALWLVETIDRVARSGIDWTPTTKAIPSVAASQA